MIMTALLSTKSTIGQLDRIGQDQGQRGVSWLHPWINVTTIKEMKTTYTPAKRELTLRDRGLDFESAVEVFAGRVHESEDITPHYVFW